MSELSKSWPIIGMAFVMWLATVILRTQRLGFDLERGVAIAVTTVSLLTIGVYIERIRCVREKEKDEEKRR